MRSPVTLVERSVATAAGAGRRHHRLPGVVTAAGVDRGAVLVQRRPVAHQLAGLLVPLVLGRSDSSRSGTTRRCTPRCSRPSSSGVITTLITVPLGVLFAIGIDRWRGRLPDGANVLMLISFVIPEMLLAVALLFVVTSLALPIDPGHLGSGGRAGDLPDLLSRRARARAAGHHRHAIRGSRNGSGRLAAGRAAPGHHCRCWCRRSSPARCWCSPTSSTTSCWCAICPATRRPNRSR